MDIKSLEDIKSLNLDQLREIDPEKINIGTCLQDCLLITQTFERGAHATPTEAATFATLNRSLENTIAFSDGVDASLNSYLKSPQEAADKSLNQAQQFISEADTGEQDTGNNGGATSGTDDILQSLNIGNEQQSTLGDSFGDALLSFAQDCIPCSLRIFSFLELHPNIDLLAALEEDLLRRLKLLSDIGKMLKNFDIYGDFCELLDLLSFMCIPDLQRIILMLTTLLMLEVPKFDGLIGVLQALIAPIFSPIFNAIIGLLDQFVLLVTNPLDCIIDSINEQLAKLGFQLDPNTDLEKFNQSLSNGLGELRDMLEESKQKIKDKLTFYIDQAKALMGDLGTGDATYLDMSLKKLKIIRMIGFIVAIIIALSKGSLACSSQGKPPEKQEIDNFFQNYLNPNNPFNLWIDDEGNINIDEKVPEFEETINPATQEEKNINILEYEGEDIVNPTLAQTITETNAIITDTSTIIVPCKLEVTAQDADKVNKFISELTQL